MKQNAGKKVRSESVMVKKGKLQNAFVYLKSGVNQSLVPKAPTEPVVLDQYGCMYTPHIQGVRTGQPILIRNSDPTLHNVHSMAKSTSRGMFMPKALKAVSS